MSSGQSRIVLNNAERVVSDDHNNLQNFSAQLVFEVIRSLTMRSWASESEPGVSIRPQGYNQAPLPGVVLDGLEMRVDTAGSVLVSEGTLATWLAPPTSTDLDSGFIVVNDPGISDINTLLVEDNAAGAQPRCDVVEVTVDVDSEVRTEPRDLYDPATELFTPGVVPKIVKSHLLYRIRKGTAGVGPGYAANWLPIGLIVQQAGNTNLATVDFYDVRPLYRDVKQDYNYDAMANSAVVNLRAGNQVAFTSGAKETGRIDGRVAAEFNGIPLDGLLKRNVPLPDLTKFGSTAVDGGDAPGVRWDDANCLRGSAMSTTAGTHIALVACFPMLDGATPVPRCVRFGQLVANQTPSRPTQRKPQGTNGILQLINIEQESVNFSTNRVLVTDTMEAPGILSCMGGAICVPLATTTIAPDLSAVPTLQYEFIGAGVGMVNERGLPAVAQRLIARGLLVSTGFDANFTSATDPVGTEVGTDTDTTFYAEAGDVVSGIVGPVWVQQSTFAGVFVRVAFEIDLEGADTPVYFDAALHNSLAAPLYIPFMFTITATGLVGMSLRGVCVDAETLSVTSMTNGAWGWYELKRP